MFESLSNQQRSWRQAVVVSLLVHIGAVVLLLVVAVPVVRFVMEPQHVTLLAPQPEIRRVPKTVVLPPPRRQTLPAILPPMAPKLVLPRIELPQAPTVEAVRTPVPELPKTVVAPAPPIKTGVFANVVPAIVPKDAKPALQPAIEVSGFAPVTNSNSTLPRGQIQASVNGFDSAATTTQGPRRGRVASGAFADASTSAGALSPHAAVTKGAFGDVIQDSLVMPRPPHGSAADSTPVEILSKPRPKYTAEALSLGLEGEVLVETVFEATGTVRVLRLVRGLGHGLDETALAAAREIRFRPARRGGVAVDSTAVIHIIFQLAY